MGDGTKLTTYSQFVKGRRIALTFHRIFKHYSLTVDFSYLMLKVFTNYQTGLSNWKMACRMFSDTYWLSGIQQPSSTYFTTFVGQKKINTYCSQTLRIYQTLTGGLKSQVEFGMIYL